MSDKRSGQQQGSFDKDKDKNISGFSGIGGTNLGQGQFGEQQRGQGQFGTTGDVRREPGIGQQGTSGLSGQSGLSGSSGISGQQTGQYGQSGEQNRGQQDKSSSQQGNK
jgi:hypothetical protein